MCIRTCMCVFVCVCPFVCMCLYTRVCACVCVCLVLEMEPRASSMLNKLSTTEPHSGPGKKGTYERILLESWEEIKNNFSANNLE